MSLFRRKPKLEPLTIPQGSVVTFPDLRVTKAFAKELGQLVDTAQRVAGELLETAKPPADGAPPLVAALARLTNALAERWWPGDAPNRDQDIDVIFERTVLGAAFALVEQQGRLVPGLVHPLISTAIAWQQTALPDEISGDLGYRCMFSLRAGYYLARVGEDATPDLVGNAD